MSMKRILTFVCMGIYLLTAAVLVVQGQAVTKAEQRTAAGQLLARGDEAFQAGEYAEATQIYKRAVEAARQEGQEEVLAEALSQVARGHLIQGEKGEGRSWLKRAEAVVSPEMPLGWSRYLGVRGRFEWKNDLLELATKTFTNMYDYCLQHELHDRAVDAAHMVAITAPHEEQIVWAKKGIEAAEAGDLQGWLGPLWNNLGWTYEEMGRYQESLDALLKAREYHWKSGSEMNKLIADWSVGYAYRKLERPDEAESWLRPVLAWAERLYAADPSPDAAEWVGFSCQELGELAIAREDLKDGHQYLRRAQESLAEAKMPEWDPDGYQLLVDRFAEIAGRVPAERMRATVVHFEIPYDEESRAISFYRDLFGWEIVKAGEMDYWLVNTVPVDEQGRPREPGINGGMMKRVAPQQAPVNYISVGSVDECLQRAESLGGTVIMPKTAIPHMGWFAHLADTEGNVLGVFQEDPTTE
jgi:predicted enzyme related to lactoylglutathione lyase